MVASVTLPLLHQQQVRLEANPASSHPLSCLKAYYIMHVCM